MDPSSLWSDMSFFVLRGYVSADDVARALGRSVASRSVTRRAVALAATLHEGDANARNADVMAVFTVEGATVVCPPPTAWAMTLSPEWPRSPARAFGACWCCSTHVDPRSGPHDALRDHATTDEALEALSRALGVDDVRASLRGPRGATAEVLRLAPGG